MGIYDNFKDGRKGFGAGSYYTNDDLSIYHPPKDKLAPEFSTTMRIDNDNDGDFVWIDVEGIVANSAWGGTVNVFKKLKLRKIDGDISNPVNRIVHDAFPIPVADGFCIDKYDIRRYLNANSVDFYHESITWARLKNMGKNNINDFNIQQSDKGFNMFKIENKGFLISKSFVEKNPETSIKTLGELNNVPPAHRFELSKEKTETYWIWVPPHKKEIVE